MKQIGEAKEKESILPKIHTRIFPGKTHRENGYEKIQSEINA